MEEKNQEQGKVIGNVGVLDIRKATEESIADVSEIRNVGTVIYSPETAHLITSVKLRNVGASVEFPAGPNARVHNGQLVISRGYFEDQPTQVFLLVNGRLEVATDVPAGDIDKGLGGLVVNGQLIYPESLAGPIQSKILQINGQEIAYPDGDRVVRGSLTLDEKYLRSLEDSSALVVIGALNVPEPLPNDLLEQKLEALHVKGRIRCFEENAETILRRFGDGPWHPDVKVIPSGFVLIDGRVVLDTDSLQALPGRKLYCTRQLQLDNQLDPAVLDERLDALIVEGLLICPTSLKAVISRKCNLLETETAFYGGEPWPVEDVLELAASRFDHLEGKASLLVFGVLTISPDIEPRVLADRLADVHNFGVINCTTEQMGAIQARLGLNDGVLSDSVEEEEAEPDIGNAGYLAL